MIDPVSGGILREGNVTYGISVSFVIELEEDAQASVCKGDMGRFKKDVIEWKMSCGLCEPLRCQELLNGGMRELDYLAFSLSDNGDKAGACGQHRPFCVPWLGSFVKRSRRCHVELDGKNIRELLDAKWADGYREALEQPSSIFSFLLIDVPQRSLVCFIQILWQVG